MSKKKSKKNKIAWCDHTWNPTTGCSKISAGCANCYACEMSRRKQAMERTTGQTKYVNGFVPTIHPEELVRPFDWKKPQKIFVNSMSDLFHDDFINTGFIQEVFKIMNDCPQHIFQVLTKRGENLEMLAPSLNWTSNIWMGVSLENQSVIQRVDNLRNTPAAIKFLSIEPLIDRLTDFDFTGIDWVIVGGEKGRNARPMDKSWVYDIKNHCDTLSIPFFFKQTGSGNSVENETLLDGIKYHNYPKLKKIENE